MKTRIRNSTVALRMFIGVIVRTFMVKWHDWLFVLANRRNSFGIQINDSF